MTETGENTRLALSEDDEKRLKAAHGIVIAQFQLTEIPEGTAPLGIKEAWLTEGLVLPVRKRSLKRNTLLPGFPYYHLPSAHYDLENYDTPTGVTGLEAIIALRNAEQTDAANYWQRQLVGHQALLVFHRSEGILIPIERTDAPRS